MDTKTNNEQTLYFIGIDQHKHFSQVAVMNPQGEILDEQKLLHEDKQAITDYFRQFPAPSSEITLEATGHWYWLYDLLDSLGQSPHLAHPLKCKLIAESRIKTDKIDAKVLANLLRTNFLPEAFVPDRVTRSLRELLRHRVKLVWTRTTFKTKIRAVLDKLGIIPPEEFSDLYTQAGVEYLKNLGLESLYQLEINNYLTITLVLTELVKELDTIIKSQLKHMPQAELLMKQPGIGYYTAYLLLVEIGDINRFNSPKKLVSYVGLAPAVHQSGNHIYFGRITKQGNPYIRTALIESAYVAIQHDDYLKSFYQRLKATKGTSKAIVATARKLLKNVYFILKGKTPYKSSYYNPPSVCSADLTGLK